ncbi:hypothetical protein D9619_005047 [Psilocybe cf. subviscida]|uniref:Uncharacterized protein n=1 Tax=Psilocybe cf. subviscida TaxID=2480587 RepID=A0A8H5F8D0_9AGAR|nr:hypothetical protein D9619_005047 [Psilocybe cf. subviscida]
MPDATIMLSSMLSIPPRTLAHAHTVQCASPQSITPPSTLISQLLSLQAFGYSTHRILNTSTMDPTYHPVPTAASLRPQEGQEGLKQHRYAPTPAPTSASTPRFASLGPASQPRDFAEVERHEVESLLAECWVPGTGC